MFRTSSMFDTQSAIRRYNGSAELRKLVREQQERVNEAVEEEKERIRLAGYNTLRPPGITRTLRQMTEDIVEDQEFTETSMFEPEQDPPVLHVSADTSVRLNAHQFRVRNRMLDDHSPSDLSRSGSIRTFSNGRNHYLGGLQVDLPQFERPPSTAENLDTSFSSLPNIPTLPPGRTPSGQSAGGRVVSGVIVNTRNMMDAPSPMPDANDFEWSTRRGNDSWATTVSHHEASLPDASMNISYNQGFLNPQYARFDRTPQHQILASEDVEMRM